MTDSHDEDVLRGRTLDIYRYVLKNKRPTGVREVQRALRLSSPRLASYHLDKLEEAGFLKKTREGYVVERVFLRHSVRLGRLLVPRYFFYSIFLLTAIVIQIVVFRPQTLRADYAFGLAVTSIAAIFFINETLRIVLERGL